MADKITKKRSVFNLSHSLKTTSRFGSIMPITHAEFVTPDTTLKSNLDLYCEIKPTTSKLNSTITSNVKSFFVPFKRVWEFADNFIASTSHFNQNASLNEPWLHSTMDKNVLKMPRIALGELPFMLLASCSPDTCDIRTPRAAVAQISRYSWNYRDIDGKIKYTDTSKNWAPWWLPRLIGAGYTQNPTINVIPQMSGDKQIGLHCITSDPYVVEYMNLLQPQYTAQFVDIFLEYDEDNLQVIVKIRNVGKDYEPMSPSQNYPIFCVKTDAQNYGSNIIVDNGGVFTNDVTIGCIYSILWGLFGRSSLLGFGSLVEALGFPLFELRKVTPYRDAKKRNDLLFPFMTCIAIDTDNFVINPKNSFNVSPFPFYAYQSIVTDRYLLPKDVLSPVTPLTGNPRNEPNYAQIDNHYCHNYVVPTKCYENDDLGLRNLWNGCVLNGGTYARSFYGITSPIDIAKRLQASLTFNQVCSIFLDRSPIIDADIFAKFWQVPDKNISSILSNVSTAIVDVNRKADAKQMAITKKLSEFLRLGGWTCSADEFIEQHFGVKDSIDTSCEVVTIATDSRYIAISDVTNTGGAVDENGNTLALGQKASVASDTANHINNFEFYSKNAFGWFLTLHHLSVANEYLNVPDVCSSRLGNLSTEDFTLMTAPEFQDTGDEPIYCDDIERGVVAYNPAVAWKEKNWFLKDKANRVCGEYVDKYRDQLIIPTDSLWNEHFAELSYVYLQKTPFDFSRYFVDAIGDNILLNCAFHMYKKAPMSRVNNVMV